jgi:CRISPR-associated endonuclease/helicase Cas3
MNMSAYYRYWAKAAKSRENNSLQYHILPYHLLDVAAVGYALLEEDARLRKRLAGLCGMTEEALHLWLTFMLALHDVGKFSKTFQQLNIGVYNVLHQTDLQKATYEYKHRHDWLGMFAWQGFLQKALPSKIILKQTAYDNAVSWAQPIFGHHGKPLDNTGEMDAMWNSSSKEKYFDAPSTEAAQAYTKEAWRLVSSKFPDTQPFNIPQKISPVASWLVAGFAVLADWIGSNSHDFPFCQEHQNLDDYWKNALQKAKDAMNGKMLRTKNVATLQGFTTLFPFIDKQTPLQQWASNQAPINGAAQLFIIEDMTGAGKTEAALMLAHRIMACNDGAHADGIFIALPTMATSNAMYERLAASSGTNEKEQKLLYQRLFAGDQEPTLVLAHGAANVNKHFQESIENFLKAEASDDEPYSNDKDKEDETISALCSRWIADTNRKAFLANVGVGTIDQVLLAALYSKFQALRLLGLHRKVLIVDEVHANDAYMHEILKRVLEFHAALGGSSILLSATLPQRMKQDLVNAFNTGLRAKNESVEQLQQAPLTEQDVKNRRKERGVKKQMQRLQETQTQETNNITVQSQEYPLATVFDGAKIIENKMETRPELVRDVKVEVIFPEEKNNAEENGKLKPFSKKVKEIISEAVKHKRCVCWIRNTVKDAVEAYEELSKTYSHDNLFLFHARFAMCDRLRIENDVLRRFGKQSASKDRAGRILIATQVVEQSLDLDFDVLITDLAPMDCIIQRAGRLHRHKRDTQGNRSDEDKREDYRTLYALAPEIPAKAHGATVGENEATQQIATKRKKSKKQNKDETDGVKASWYRDVFKGGAVVYPNHAQLWRTAKILAEKKSIQTPDNIRPFIEKVFGTRANEIETPKELMKSEDNASGSDAAKRSAAMTNSIRLLEGYRHSYNSWFDDKKIPTRLGDESATLRLAVKVGEDIRPFAARSDEEFQALHTRHDWRVGWAKSEVRVRASQVKELPKPDKTIQSSIETLLADKDKMPDKCKYATLLLLAKDTDSEIWKSAGVKDDKKQIQYSIKTGFKPVSGKKKGGN